uniref:F-box domain-containing protein n=1 Tax=Oryza nivara TaxID=4536 RepID=A0A0E0IKN6_ORYNI
MGSFRQWWRRRSVLLARGDPRDEPRRAVGGLPERRAGVPVGADLAVAGAAHRVGARAARTADALADFRDRSAPRGKSPAFSAFVRAYFRFLNYRSLLAAEEDIAGDGDDHCVARLERITKLQFLLELLLQIRPYCDGMEVPLVLEAMDCALIEILQVYGEICTGVARFLVGVPAPTTRPRQTKSTAVAGIKVLRKAAEKSAQLSSYFELCRSLGVVNVRELEVRRQRRRRRSGWCSTMTRAAARRRGAVDKDVVGHATCREDLVDGPRVGEDFAGQPCHAQGRTSLVGRVAAGEDLAGRSGNARGRTSSIRRQWPWIMRSWVALESSMLNVEASDMGAPVEGSSSTLLELGIPEELGIGENDDEEEKATSWRDTRGRSAVGDPQSPELKVEAANTAVRAAVKRCAEVPISARPGKMMRIAIKSWSRFLPPYIPDDVIFDILLRLPSKSLIRFKSVCKAWHAIISNPCFISAHLECSKQKPSIFMVPGVYEKQNNGENTSFLMGLYQYQGGNIMEQIHVQDFPQGIGTWSRPIHCNGMLLISTMNHEMIVCNPSTREIVSLPKGSYNLHAGPRAGFGFDPHSNKYKVARFFYQRDDDTSELVCKFEVLTLGTNLWRQTEDPPYPISGLTPVHVKGAIYWMVNMPLCPDPPNAFLRFCLTNEKFSLLQYPPCNLKPTRFIEVEGELCCACFCSQVSALKIWTCNYAQNPEWTQRCTVQIPPDIVVNNPVARPPIVFLHGKKLLLTWNQVYQYDIQTCRMEKIASGVEDFTCYDPRNNKYWAYLEKEVTDMHLFNYAESLVPIREF